MNNKVIREDGLGQLVGCRVEMPTYSVTVMRFPLP